MEPFDKALEDLFSKLPSLPQNIKDVVVKVLPWLNLIGLVLALPAILVALGLSSFAYNLASASGGWAIYGGGIIGLVLAAASLAFHALAINGLFARTASGWKYLYWATLIGGLESLLMFDIVNLIVATGLALYFLYQVKPSFYK